MAALPARSIGIAIDCPFEKAYAFAHRPENFPRCAAGLSSSLHHDGKDWVAETLAGTATIKFSDRNDFGILDHWVNLPGKPQIYIPLRMIRNGSGIEVILTLFRQPEMDDAAFKHDAGLIEKDLKALKNLLENA